MPPKPKFTKEEIVAAALELVSANGIEALTARELSAYLGSSARPIFTVLAKKSRFCKKNAVIQNPILFEKGMDIRGKT